MAQLIQQTQIQKGLSIEDQKCMLRKAMEAIKIRQLPLDKGLAFETRTHYNQIALLPQWQFRRSKTKLAVDGKESQREVYTLTIYLKLPSAVPQILEADQQRQIVDALHIIHHFNCRTANPFKTCIHRNNRLSLTHIFEIRLYSHEKSLTNYLKHLNKTLKDSLEKLINNLLPYLKQPLPSTQLNGTNQQKSYIKISHAFLVFIEYHLAHRTFFSNNPDPTPEPTRQILTNLNQMRQEAMKKVELGFSIARGSWEKLKDVSEKELDDIQNSYKEWLRVEKKTKPKKKGDPKNVYGVRILQEPHEDREGGSGTHSKILLGRYRVIFTTSVNAETNKSLPQKQDSKMQIELQLAKKTLTDDHRTASANSLQNEIKFIEFIRDRRCEFITTYYLQEQKKREEMNYIMMDYYPQNLEELISYELLPSISSRVRLLEQITRGVSWLADNRICHRDLKPPNIMLDSHQGPKLLDFGSCCSTEGETSFKVAETRLLSTEGYYCNYASIEPALRSRIPKAAYNQHILFDAYSIGQIMEDLLGKSHHYDPHLRSILKYISNKCKEQDPSSRMTYEEMAFLLDKINKLLEEDQAKPRH